jgi:acyl-coenzyme A thioesterase PaaI-like protein
MSAEMPSTTPLSGDAVPWLEWRRPEASATEAFGHFVETLRDLQDAAVCADVPEETVIRISEQLDGIVAELTNHAAPEGVSVAGRAANLPGRGSLLLPAWVVEDATPEGVRLCGRFRRYHLGLNGAVHGGAIPLVYDHLIALAAEVHGRPISRTVHLAVDYRSLTPTDAMLCATGRVTKVEGRKTFLAAEITDAHHTVLSECTAIMVALREHHR